MEFLKYILSDFWIFVGFAILFGMPFGFLGYCWSKYLQHLNIKRYGYPPEHCDASGSFPSSDDYNKYN